MFVYDILVFSLFTLFKILHFHYFNIAYNIFRILWFFVIVIGVTLFTYQVTDRIIVYYRRKTNVDVAVKYVQSFRASLFVTRISSGTNYSLFNLWQIYSNLPATNKELDTSDRSYFSIFTIFFVGNTDTLVLDC